MTAPGSTAPLAVTRTDTPLPPGATIGVFGGGQLGRMLGVAARRLGYRFAVFSDDHDGPASHVADRSVQASYDDEGALEDFARSVDAVTFEFENVPSVAGEIAARHCPVRPRGGLLHTVQTRQREKDGLVGIGLPVARFAPVRSADELLAAGNSIPGAGVLKTASFGYDGKGQVKSRARTSWRQRESLGRADAVLETPCLEREVSVVAARGVDGSIAIYEPFQNDHANHILDVTTCPAELPDAQRARIDEIARVALEGLDVVGVLCIELFLLPGGDVLVNEIAPRPHNSGHLTVDSHVTRQFQMQARAVAGLLLGSSASARPRHGEPAPWADGEPRWDRASPCPASSSISTQGRRSPGEEDGHLTAIGDLAEAARARAAREPLRPDGARRARTGRPRYLDHPPPPQACPNEQRIPNERITRALACCSASRRSSISNSTASAGETSRT